MSRSFFVYAVTGLLIMFGAAFATYDVKVDWNQCEISRSTLGATFSTIALPPVHLPKDEKGCTGYPISNVVYENPFWPVVYYAFADAQTMTATFYRLEPTGSTEIGQKKYDGFLMDALKDGLLITDNDGMTVWSPSSEFKTYKFNAPIGFGRVQNGAEEITLYEDGQPQQFFATSVNDIPAILMLQRVPKTFVPLTPITSYDCLKTDSSMTPGCQEFGSGFILLPAKVEYFRTFTFFGKSIAVAKIWGQTFVLRNPPDDFTSSLKQAFDANKYLRIRFYGHYQVMTEGKTQVWKYDSYPNLIWTDDNKQVLYVAPGIWNPDTVINLTK